MEAFSPQRIVSWISGLGNTYKQQRAMEQELRATTDLVVDVADPVIRQVGRYQKDLREAMTTASGYCTELVDDIPGPVRLSRRQYHADPLVKAVFASADQMMDILKSAVRNQSSEEWKKRGEGAALLTMTRTERTIMGYEKHKDMVLGDVAKRTVNFTDHKIVALSSDLATAKKKLVQRALEALASVATEKIAAIRGRVDRLRERKAHLQSLRRIFSSRNRTVGLFSHPSYEAARKIERINEQLVEVEAELAIEHERLAAPGDSLRLLKEILASPAESLLLARKSFRVDWMNVLLAARDAAEGNDISLAELSLGGNLQRWAVMVTFRSEDVGDV